MILTTRTKALALGYCSAARYSQRGGEQHPLMVTTKALEYRRNNNAELDEAQAKVKKLRAIHYLAVQDKKCK